MIFANQLASHVRMFLIRQPLPAAAFVAAVSGLEPLGDPWTAAPRH
jgi:hypothetical protein